MINTRKIISLFSILLLFGTVRAQSVQDSLWTTQFFDCDNKLFLEKVVKLNMVDKQTGNYRFFKSDGNFFNVNIHFDAANKSILHLMDIYKMLTDVKYQKDSVVLLTCIYYDSSGNFNDYRIIYCNDKACKAAFKTDMKINEDLKRKIKKDIPTINYPLLLIKEWTCETHPLYSIYH